MKLRKLLVLLLLLGAAFVLSACGEQGAQGETGDTGLKGETGAQGDKGPTGPAGEAGAKGENGANGVGIQFSYGSEGILWRYIGASEWNVGVEYEEIFKLLETGKIAFDYYVDPSLSLGEGDPLIVHGNELVYGQTAFNSVGSALTAIAAKAGESGYKGATLFLEAGTYADAIDINIDNLTIKGANTGLTLVHDSEFDVNADENTILTGKVTVAAKGFTLRGVVTKSQIVANAAEDLTLKEIVLTENTSNGIVEFNGANKNVKIDKVYTYGKSGNRSFYVYGSIENLVVRRCVLMDNCKSVYDWFRVSAGTEARLYGDILFEYNYIAQTNQSGFMDRFPRGSKYTFQYNYMANIPAAIYFRHAKVDGVETVANIEYVLEYNTFDNCGDIPNDWDVLALTTSDTTSIAAHHNNFIDCLSTSGTNTDYIFNIRTLAGTIDCADNFCNNETTKAMNKNATGLTWAEAAFELPELPVDKLSDDKYEALLNQLGNAFIADVNATAGTNWDSFDDIDTDHCDSGQLVKFYTAEGMAAKWGWLFQALSDLSEDDSHDPSAEGFDLSDHKPFYFANLCGFFTVTEHKDTHFGSVSMDFTDEAKVFAVLDQYVAPIVIDEALLASLASAFVTDYNATCSTEMSTAADLDTANLGGKTIFTFYNNEAMKAKWGWLYQAMASFDPSFDCSKEGFDTADLDNMGFYLSNINGFFTRTQHKDTYCETTSQDFTDDANVAKVLGFYAG